MGLLTIDLEPVRTELDGRLLAALIGRYLAECELSVKPSTVNGYWVKLNWVLLWWKEAGPGCDWLLNRARLADLEKWLRDQRGRRGQVLSYNTRRDVLRRLRQCLIWAYRSGAISEDVSHLVPLRPAGSAPLRRPLLPDLIARLLDGCESSSMPLRDAAIVALLAGTGLRRAEAAGLQVADLRFDADGGGLLTVHEAKMDRSRLVVFDAVTGRYLGRWLDTGPLPPGGSLFGLGGKSIYNVVKAAAAAAGVADQIQGPHDLRRLFCQHWARNRRGEGHGQLLMLQLGHSSWATTMKYNAQQIDDLRLAFVSPVALAAG